MATKRVFVSFAIEDETTKYLFTGQSKNAKVPYEFIDMSVKEPWSTAWKERCRSRIKGCDGVIVLISKSLKKADGALWEIKCAIEEDKKLIGIYIGGGSYSDKPSEMFFVNCKEWTWDNIKDFIESL